LSAEWIVSSPWENRDAAAARWQVPPIVAQIMFNRGIEMHDDPADFLVPQLRNLIPPEKLAGASEAAAQIVQAVRSNKKIVLYGDYDVDGMTGVAILWHVLTLAGANVAFYIPHRIEEGYGLNCDALRSLLTDGAEVIISVDCGVTAVDAAKLVAGAGATLIITDHHQFGQPLPSETILVHPALDEAYGNPHLCGAGVAFKLAWAVAKELCNADKVSEPYRTFLRDALALAALGTIADIVPLTGENRIIARHGLALVTTTPFVGLQALLETSGLVGGKLSAYDVGFKLGPRLNAVGRMGHARLGVELLTRADANRAREIALYLDDQNRTRRATERKITTQAREIIEQKSMGGDAQRAIVLAHEGWHAGVIGIVASRIVGLFHRPTVLISLDGDEGQGSARSITGFDLAASLTQCSDLLLAHGGHPMAAGLKIRTDKVDEFAGRFIEIANKTLTARDMCETLRIDAEVPLGELDVPTAEALEGLGPFGVGNPKPRLSTDWVELAAEPRCVGQGGNHLQATLSDGRSVLKAIGFGKGDVIDELKLHRRCKVAFQPLINDYNGRRTVEMQALDFKFPNGD
jgi:single-stranded-DNA-specific exonuclease